MQFQINSKIAKEMSKVFFEVILAKKFDKESLKILGSNITKPSIAVFVNFISLIFSLNSHHNYFLNTSHIEFLTDVYLCNPYRKLSLRYKQL